MNNTEVTVFILLQLWNSPDEQIIFVLTFILIYIITITGNLIIIVICSVEKTLCTPMYFFLNHLAALEICYISVTVPKMLFMSVLGDNTISPIACLTQLYFFGSLGSTECILLAIMAYDRYLAICKPLHYHIHMTSRLCNCLVGCCWSSGFISAMFSVYFISRLQFCGPNQIQHFFCDISPLLKLSCTDVHNTETLIFFLASVILMGSCLITLLSYFRILSTILSISSRTKTGKASSTFASHLTVVSVYYSTMIFVYVRPTTANASRFNKVLSILYTVLTPFLNPFIYTLRNKDAQRAIVKIKNTVIIYLLR
ncbi:olfactory receptor 6B1-like [Bombina bombina]|uniref:olfactory receptor 6B1-like n=1 Tax=Bombina bombina TaxID=8345 RepID=UPI00235B2FE4|nr:olfactory receptor 6B1-like [Bombina bombina]